MAKSEKDQGQMRISPEGGRMGGVKRFVITVVILAVIVLVCGIFAARTEGARRLAGEKLGKRLGMELKIGEMRIGWPYVLVLDRVESEDEAPDEGGPLFKAREIRLAPGIDPRWRITARQCGLKLVRDRGGAWTPTALGRLGAIPRGGMEKISWVTEEFRDSVALKVRDSGVEWLDSSGRVISSASGISFDVRPVEMGDRRMYYHRLVVYNVLGESLLEGHNMEREWLAGKGADYIELERETANHAPAAAGYANFRKGDKD
ncbi:MAG: hypothetical protein R6V03_05475 [Kiritimatiellia bacterium]